MKNPRRLVGYIIFLLLLLLFFLFSPSRVRFISIFVFGSIILTYGYNLLIPLFITARHVFPSVRGIKIQPMTIRLEVINRTPIPVSFFTLDDSTGGLIGEEHSFLVSLRPLERRIIDYTVKGQQRGEYVLGPMRLKGTDPLGLFSWSKRIDSTMRAIVYPTIRSMDLINKQGLPAGNIAVNDKMYEDVTQFRSLREYVPGDDMKRINWKASAKTNKLYTMEFDSTLYFPVLIVLNFSMEDFPLRSRSLLVERAAELAASLAFYYAGLKQEIGLVTSGAVVSDPTDAGSALVVQGKAGYEHAQEILEVIAKLKPTPGRIDFNSMLFRSGSSIAMGTKVMVVTPRVSESQAQSLISARRRGLNIQVLQVESMTERRDADILSGALPVISVREMDEGSINE